MFRKIIWGHLRAPAPGQMATDCILRSRERTPRRTKPPGGSVTTLRTGKLKKDIAICGMRPVFLRITAQTPTERVGWDGRLEAELCCCCRCKAHAGRTAQRCLMARGSPTTRISFGCRRCSPSDRSGKRRSDRALSNKSTGRIDPEAQFACRNE